MSWKGLVLLESSHIMDVQYEAFLADGVLREYLEKFVKSFADEFEFRLSECKRDARLEYSFSTRRFWQFYLLYLLLTMPIMATLVHDISPANAVVFYNFAAVLGSELFVLFRKGLLCSKAKKVMNILQFVDWRPIIVHASCELFRIYEAQFASIVKLHEDGVRKVVTDAVFRMFVFLDSNYERVKSRKVDADLVVEAVLNGSSRYCFGFFLSLRKCITTRAVFDYPGIYDSERDIYYNSTTCFAKRYGYRLKLRSERDLDERLVNPSPTNTYTYSLTEACSKTMAASLITSKQDPAKRVFNAPYPVSSFTGRRQELKVLFNLWEKHILDSQRKCSVVCVCGVHGIGKSELVKKFAHDAVMLQNVLWISAQSFNHLMNSFLTIARQLEISCSGEELSDIVKEIYGSLSDQTLTIFDGVFDYGLLHKFLPWNVVPGRSKHFVVFTTRTRHWSFRDAAKFVLLPFEGLNKNEAISYIKGVLKVSRTDTSQNADIEMVSSMFGNNPLALSHITEYVQAKQRMAALQANMYKISNFLKEYGASSIASKSKILRFHPEADHFCRGRPLLSSWESELMGLKGTASFGPDAINLLKTLCLSWPDGFDLARVEDDAGFWELVYILDQHCFLKTEEKSIKLNPSIQEIVEILVTLDCI